ncbi:MAG: NotI family restriction endonuclease [Pseudomonadota bacterium]
MRASGRDIVELFGYSPDDISRAAVETWKNKSCPFTGGTCTKTNHDQSIIYGTCSVSSGVNQAVGSEVIVCPKRLYAEKYQIFERVVESAWPNKSKTLVIGGTLDQLKTKAKKVANPVIAFGQGSGKEMQADSMSMDWVLQSYKNAGQKLSPHEFVGLEIQSIDITGNYRDAWSAYKKIKEGKIISSVPPSGHGLKGLGQNNRIGIKESGA